jgi:uncharacterized protein (DUF849 family)
MKKVIIEARVNEYSMRDRNPNVPWTPDELIHDAIDCEAAGAASFHFHARNPDGSPDLSYETYREVIAGVQQETDLLIQPTLGVFMQDADPKVRLENILRLAAEGHRPEFAPLDMGSTNVDLFGDDGTFATEETVYTNSTATLRYFADACQDQGVKPYLHIWNIPQLRVAGAFYRLGILRGPVWMGLSHSGDCAPIYHPATIAGLEAYINVLPADVPIEWSANAYEANLLDLAPRAIEAGGHIAIGIGDYAYPELGSPTNADVVDRVVSIAEGLGRHVASPREARTMLGIAIA